MPDIPLLKLWNEELRLKDKIAQVKKRMDLHFDVSAALFFVTAQQLIRPCRLQTPDLHKNCWLGDPARSVPSADLYDQAYTFLFTNGGSIFNWLRRQSVELTGDELTPIICYDQESACAVTIDGHGMAVGCDSFASCAGNCTKLCQQLYFMHLEERSSAPLVITGSNLDLPAHAELLRRLQVPWVLELPAGALPAAQRQELWEQCRTAADGTVVKTDWHNRWGFNCTLAAFYDKELVRWDPSAGLRLCAYHPERTEFTAHELYRLINLSTESLQFFKQRPLTPRPIRPLHVELGICVLAQALLRRLQLHLTDLGVKLSAEQICTALREMLVMVMPDPDGTCRYLSLSLSSDGSGKDREDILYACGLSPLPQISTFADLNQALHTHFRSDKGILPENCSSAAGL